MFGSNQTRPCALECVNDSTPYLTLLMLHRSDWCRDSIQLVSIRVLIRARCSYGLFTLDWLISHPTDKVLYSAGIRLMKSYQSTGPSSTAAYRGKVCYLVLFRINRQVAQTC